MLGLTPLGTIHTAISLVAVAAGLVALVRNKRITWHNTLGKTYVITTILTCLTGFGIFQHGGFGKPHALGVLTLLVIALALAIRNRPEFKALATEAVAYSATFAFHLIPAVTETTTRLPLGAPLLPNADAPELQVFAAVLAALLLVGAVLQVRRLKRIQAGGSSPSLAAQGATAV
ncbi:hypothetical protein [Chitinolyticbacter albus]|uniref:hypothetical protein n=1 Tax=Chitinolyticbacter albus TaxID=2961951 RepID=UPI00210E3D09|nr:hypothetical protein [Chitinolyticbacter albus]